MKAVEEAALRARIATEETARQAWEVLKACGAVEDELLNMLLLSHAIGSPAQAPAEVAWRAEEDLKLCDQHLRTPDSCIHPMTALEHLPYLRHHRGIAAVKVQTQYRWHLAQKRARPLLRTFHDDAVQVQGCIQMQVVHAKLFGSTGRAGTRWFRSRHCTASPPSGRCGV